jgi:hypothetical protein
MGTALGNRGFSGTGRSGTGGLGGAGGVGGEGGTGVGRFSGGSCLVSGCGRFTIVTGVISGVSGSAGFIRSRAAITSAWNARDIVRDVVKRKRGCMRCIFKMQNAKYKKHEMKNERQEPGPAA